MSSRGRREPTLASEVLCSDPCLVPGRQFSALLDSSVEPAPEQKDLELESRWRGTLGRTLAQSCRDLEVRGQFGLCPDPRAAVSEGS